MRKLVIAFVATVFAAGAGGAVLEYAIRSRLLRESGATDFESLRSRYLGKDLKIFARDESGELDLVPATSQKNLIKINEQGFRGAPVAVPKPADVHRIVCIGGSGCFGTTSSGDNKTFPAFLEERLRAGKQAAVEVVNGGLPGATTARAITRFEKHLAKLKPDVVILYNLINDLLSSRHAALGLDERTLPLVEIGGPISNLLSHSAIWLQSQASRTQAQKIARASAATAREAAGNAKRDGKNPEALRVKELVRAEQKVAYDGEVSNNLYLVPEHLAEFRAQLVRFHRVITNSGAIPVYCTFAFRFIEGDSEANYLENGPATAYWMPNWPMVRDAIAIMNQAIRDEAKHTGSLLIDISSEMPRRAELFAPKDTDHFSDAGCQIAGEIVARALESAQLGTLRRDNK